MRLSLEKVSINFQRLYREGSQVHASFSRQNLYFSRSRRCAIKFNEILFSTTLLSASWIFRIPERRAMLFVEIKLGGDSGGNFYGKNVVARTHLRAEG